MPSKRSQTLSPEGLEILRQLKSDFDYYAPRCLKIRTKSGEMQTFRINATQRYVHERLEEQKAETGKVRALILKARQVGISTYVAGRYYWKTSLNQGLQAFILTHRDDATSNLFDLAKRYHDNCPEAIKPKTGFANAKELTFPSRVSGYKVATAGGKEVGRSATIQLFHGSEMAFWANADLHAAGIGQAIADEPGTEDIRESTANGIGNAFHTLWKAAEQGDSEYLPIFIPWFWHEEYTRTAPEGWTPPVDWREYAEAHGLSKDQTHWAYCKSRELSSVTGEDPTQISWKFRQEYPATAAEAFQTSGLEALIRPEKVLSARKGEVSGYGPLILGIDPARGGGDKTGIIDRQGRRLGGNICKRLDVSDLMALAGQIVQIHRSLNATKIVIDTTGLGAGLYDRLRELLGDKVEGVNFGAKAHDFTRYANRRAEMWDEMRQWFDDVAGVQVPDSDELQADLCAVPAPGNGLPNSTRFNSSGQLILEPKDKLKERLTYSPDLGDAAALTFAADFSEIAEPDLEALDFGMPQDGGWMAA